MKRQLSLDIKDIREKGKNRHSLDIQIRESRIVKQKREINFVLVGGIASICRPVNILFVRPSFNPSSITDSDNVASHHVDINTSKV